MEPEGLTLTLKFDLLFENLTLAATMYLVKVAIRRALFSSEYDGDSWSLWKVLFKQLS